MRHSRLATLGEIAEFYLHELKVLGIGRPAPEIEGVDLDGRPMKLSDYRGRVVLIYFGGPVPPSADERNRPARVTESVQALAQRRANDRFALLGVSTVSPGRNAGREAYQSSLKARGMPARFWWDLDQFNQPGPIQTAWNARDKIAVFVLDHRGVIRYKQVYRPELLEKAVATLLKEQKDEMGQTKKSD
jgi:hypothetical protein